MVKNYLKGIGLLVGLIFGAGVFALPYAIAKSGLFWGVFHFIAAFLLILLMHFLYAKISYFVPGRHRLTGYVGIILGKSAKWFSFFISIATYYGSLLAYGVLGGVFLSNFLPKSDLFDPFFFSVLFFLVGGVLVYLRLGKIASINFYLTVPIFIYILYLFFGNIARFNFENFLSESSSSGSAFWFLPYGIWVFALTGFSAIPQVKDIFSSSPYRDFRRVVFLGTVLPAIFYWIFIISIAGLSGETVSQDAFSGIAGGVSRLTLLLGSIIGFLAVFTSFLAIGVDLREIFNLDFKISRPLAWILAVFPPLILFIFGVNNLTLILALIGTVGLGAVGTLIILMARKIRKKNNTVGVMMPLFEVLVALAVLAAVTFEIWNLFR